VDVAVFAPDTAGIADAGAVDVVCFAAGTVGVAAGAVRVDVEDGRGAVDAGAVVAGRAGDPPLRGSTRAGSEKYTRPLASS
jgi:hypothetical protein